MICTRLDEYAKVAENLFLIMIDNDNNGDRDGDVDVGVDGS